MENITNPKISIIIPIYKSEKFLHKCLDSIFNQDYENYEIVCVNDASPDNCEKIINNYLEKGCKIKYIKNSINKGAGESRNIGIEKACGEYIMFLDSDDWLENSALSKLSKYLDNFPNIDILSYLFYDVEPNKPKTLNKTVPEEIVNKKLDMTQNPEYFQYLGFGTTKLIKRNILVENNIKFNNDVCLEDLSYYFDLVPYIKDVVFTNEIIFCYRHVPKSRNTKSRKHIDYYTKNIKKAEEYISNYSLEQKSMFLKNLYQDLFLALYHAYGFFEIPFSKFKNTLAEYINPEYIELNLEPYHVLLYKKICQKNLPSIYFRILFILKFYFPILFKIYKYFKR